MSFIANSSFVCFETIQMKMKIKIRKEKKIIHEKKRKFVCFSFLVLFCLFFFDVFLFYFFSSSKSTSRRRQSRSRSRWKEKGTVKFDLFLFYTYTLYSWFVHPLIAKVSSIYIYIYLFYLFVRKMCVVVLLSLHFFTIACLPLRGRKLICAKSSVSVFVDSMIKSKFFFSFSLFYFIFTNKFYFPSALCVSCVPCSMFYVLCCCWFFFIFLFLFYWAWSQVVKWLNFMQ